LATDSKFQPILPQKVDKTAACSLPIVFRQTGLVLYLLCRDPVPI
jgi:hypothetical protein